MNGYVKLFYSVDEPYAAGLFEEPEGSYFYRHSLGYARYIDSLAPAVYEAGENLYPRNKKFDPRPKCVRPAFFQTYNVDLDGLKSKNPFAYILMKGFHSISRFPVGGDHAAPNYKRIVKEGLDSYQARVEQTKDPEFREGLLEILRSLRSYVERSILYLEQVHAPARLIEALKQVPFQPARNYYEGLVCWNLIFYFDNGDNLGYLDDGLAHLYAGEDYSDIIGELFSNVETLGSWSCTIGGRYNGITRQALKAIQGHYRPMLELRINKDMPEDLWELAVERIREGSTNPSFYNDQGIHDMLKNRFPQIPEEELKLFVGCGCTETNLQGLTSVNADAAHVPLLRIFENYMHKNLTKACSFEDFFEGMCQDMESRIAKILAQISENLLYEAKYMPNPIRTLFFDDCIDRELDFHAGGARYTWAQFNHSGMINVIDSLASIRELVFRKKLYTPEEFLEKLTAEDPVLFAQFKKCPSFGRDDDDVDTLAVDYVTRVYNAYHRVECKGFVDGIFLSEHQFGRFHEQGMYVGPTPDGRKNSAPTCDSIAALRGKAVEGPTAMLKSSAKLPQHLAEGISVLNLSISKDFTGAALKALVESYFDLGGIQVQISCSSVEEMKDAMIHPEDHQDLIVRVGGYSSRFIDITPDLQKDIIQRNIHQV